MNTATITFHASHNYGSMLQAYALQQTVRALGHDNVIVNLRTERQRNLYPVRPMMVGSLPMRVIRYLLWLPYFKAYRRKYELFEAFLSENLVLTQEYASLQELEKADLAYDCFIAGGDQIWNTIPDDFDWSFYLPFVKQGKKISYAVSMGPHAEKHVQFRDRIKGCLSTFDHISVREQGTRDLIETLDIANVEETVDPTLLLTKGEWMQHYAATPMVRGDYVLVYTPQYNEQVYDLAEEIGKALGMPVVTTMYRAAMVRYRSFKKVLQVGPWEFLNLLDNARVVVSGSFHAVLFSALFNRPFVAVDGLIDNRMRTLLENAGLEHCAMNRTDWKEKLPAALAVDFSQANEYIRLGREAGLDYLKRAITE